MRYPLAAVGLAFAANAALAGVPTLVECAEASDFIANAARARDNGIARSAFLARLDDDLIVIRAFPVSLRWFAKDVEDERLLLDAAARVFDRPGAPEAHHADFLASCLERAIG
jgi:hypothetical protein